MIISDVDLFRAEGDDVLEYRCGLSADAAEWTADGTHEVEQNPAPTGPMWAGIGGGTLRCGGTRDHARAPAMSAL